MNQIKVRTRSAIVANRVFVNGEADLPDARYVQQGVNLLPLSVFQKQGLKFAVPNEYDYERFVFKASAPEPLRLFDEIGFGMKTYLSSSDDFSDPDVGAAQQIGLSIAKGFDWQSLSEPTKRGLARAAITAPAIHREHLRSCRRDCEWLAVHNGGRSCWLQLRDACGILCQPDGGQRPGGNPVSEHARGRQRRSAVGR
jgi:hypothetical protein